MPWAFQSINRGVIPFGFFNIETDMLLLDQYFFFDGEFCNFIGDLAEQEKEAVFRSSLAVDLIADRQQIGDLMGAIHDVHYSGFIGEVYRRFPFPRREEDFKQKPSGSQNREALKKLIAGYAEKIEIQFQADPVQETVLFGELLFRKVVSSRVDPLCLAGRVPQVDG